MRRGLGSFLICLCLANSMRWQAYALRRAERPHFYARWCQSRLRKASPEANSLPAIVPSAFQTGAATEYATVRADPSPRRTPTSLP
jgi:hypothetical protein